MEKIKLGISACLLGENVRYDGGHKLDRFLRDTLGQYVDYVPVCPETECGLGVPRESMRLEGHPSAPRLVTNQTRRDLTEKMVAWGRRRLEQLAAENLCGFIFKSNSPSSGMERVKVYGEKGMPSKTGAGIFARMFMDRFPSLPVEDEGRLHDPDLRENFIERIFVMQRWRAVLAPGARRGDLLDFHTRHKLLILSHSQAAYARMGKLLADMKTVSLRTLFDQYEALLTDALRLGATPKKNANVLQHMAGYFKKHLEAAERQELKEVIDQYRTGLIPLIVPVTLLRHYVRKYDQPYLKEQIYLTPHPLELRLRNHV